MSSEEPNSVQMIDTCAANLSDYSYPFTKTSNWTPVIGYPHDCAEPFTSEHFVIDAIRLRIDITGWNQYIY